MDCRRCARAGVLASIAVLGATSLARAQCEDWSGGFGVPGASGRIHDLLTWDDGGGPDLYAGGHFGAFADLAAQNIVQWDGIRWSNVGDGVPGRLLALAGYDDGSGAALYAAGDFDSAGGTPATNLARWDGSSWAGITGLSSGPAEYVNALSVFDDGSGAALYAGGSFFSAGGQPAGGIARWNGQTWSPVGGGTDGTVYSLAVFDDGSGPALYAGGHFVHAGGIVVNHIARWNGTSWSALAAGVSMGGYGKIAALSVFDDGSGDALFIAGNFAVGSSIRNVARWDGSSWTAVGTSVGYLDSLAVHDEGTGARLYAGTAYTADVLRLDTSGWTSLGLRTTSPGEEHCYALASYAIGPGGGSALIAGGEFSVESPRSARACIAWEAGSWQRFGGDQHGLDQGASDVCVFDDGAGPALYVAGSFLDAAGGPALGLARWNGAGWSAVPGANRALNYTLKPNVVDLVAHPGPGGIAAGLYAVTGDPSYVIHWDGQTWSGLGTVPGSTWDAGSSVAELYDDGSGGGAHLFIGGDLGIPVSQWGIVEWDGSGWRYLGNGVQGTVGALAVYDDGTGPALYVGGSFEWVSNLPAYNIARWDGSSWSMLDSGLDDGVNALAVFDDGSGPALYAGGEFTVAGSVSAVGVARWNGTAWSAVGGGIPGTPPAVTALSVQHDGIRSWLVAAGRFDAAGGVSARNIARWNGTSWAPMGEGIAAGFGPRSMVQFDDGAGPALWIAGDLQQAGGHPSVGIARWKDECTCEPIAYCTAKVNSQGCTPAVSWSGTPSATAPAPFVIAAHEVVNRKNGLLIYGLQGWAAQPFDGGILCVRPPIRRTAAQNSGGNPPPDDCSGLYAYDFNARIQSQVDPALVPGAQVRCQFWSRDPASSFGAGLTDAIAFQVCP